jgi:protein SCO1
MTDDNTNPPANNPRVPFAIWAALGAGATALAALVAYGVTSGAFSGRPAPPAATATPCDTRSFAQIGGPFALVDHNGRAVTEKSFLGRPALIYFGFTYCPDICPMSLQAMRLALETAAETGGQATQRIQPILISLDPERDTPAALKSYVASNGFPAGLVGLTGTLDQVAVAAKAYRVGYRKALQPDSAADYLIDHTSILYLLDSKGQMKTFFSSGTDPTEMGKCIGKLVREGL